MRFKKTALILTLPILTLFLTYSFADAAQNYFSTRVIARNSAEIARFEKKEEREARREQRLQRRSVETPRPKADQPLAETPTKQITVSPTKKLTTTPTSTPTRKPNTPTPTKSGTQTTSVQDFIMSEINKYRASHGLSAVKTDPYTCAFAKTRAEEITNGFNHDGFSNRVDSKSLPYPSYSSVTENIAMTSNYKDVVNMWINSSGHAANMRQDTPYVCVAQNGNYFAYEGWRP